MKFNTEQELYDRVLPALTSKVSELERKNIKNIKQRDIWQMLKQTKWMTAHDLTLAEIVSDILNLNPLDIEAYYSDIEELI
jgi:hypothetical protein